jgi:hypothetical protein
MVLLLSLPAGAEPSAGPGGDCNLARDPLRCQAFQNARNACKDKRGAGKQKCIQEKLPAPDCARDHDPARCAARQVAHETCKGKTGKTRQSCLRDLDLATTARVQAKR